MKKTIAKKMMLSRETLRHLTGGVLAEDKTTIPTTLQDPPLTSDSVRACCA
jgi:hypothetical protein